MEVSFKKNLFGKEIEFILYDIPKEKAEKIINESYSEALKLQKIFSVFYDKSEISELNKKRKMKVSKELLSVIKKALEFSKMTGGKYDISIGKEISNRKKGKPITIKKDSYKNVKIFFNTVTLKDGAYLDLGSIAKGYITDKIGKILKEKGAKEFLIDSRGDILLSGNFFHIIKIQHPRKNNETICSLKLRNEAVATSGDYNQFSGTMKNTHILNRNQEIISVTVVSKTLEQADVLATAIFVSNKNEIEKLMDKNQESKAMVINKDLTIDYYNNFRSIIK